MRRALTPHSLLQRYPVTPGAPGGRNAFVDAPHLRQELTRRGYHFQLLPVRADTDEASANVLLP